MITHTEYDIHDNLIVTPKNCKQVCIRGMTCEEIMKTLTAVTSYEDFIKIVDYIKRTMGKNFLEKHLEPFKKVFFKMCMKRLNSRKLTREEAERIEQISHSFSDHVLRTAEMILKNMKEKR